jgi:hypothetical protein
MVKAIGFIHAAACIVFVAFLLLAAMTSLLTGNGKPTSRDNLPQQAPCIEIRSDDRCNEPPVPPGTRIRGDITI